MATLIHPVFGCADIVFLHGYYEPTILVLFKKGASWAGRVTRYAGCSMVALSLSLSQRRHPVIWRINGLPFNASSLTSLPAPLGGALVFCRNSVLYFNQVWAGGRACACAGACACECACACSSLNFFFFFDVVVVAH